LAGSVTDESPSATQVTFGGSVSGSVTPNAGGYFTFVTPATGSGQVTATARDNESLSSLTSASMAATPLAVLTLAVTYNARRSVTLSGTLHDVNPGGRTVSLTGQVTAQAITSANGNFSVTQDAAGLGVVQASATSSNGLPLSTSVTLTSNAPVIQGFWAGEGPGRIWTFSGRVVDESPEDLVVGFGGGSLPSLCGRSATVNAGGTFSTSVQLQPGEEGLALASTIDWWGLASAEAQTLVDPT
jgi:hypothetical protein